MAKYRITGPDGAVFSINAPDDATPDQVKNYAFSQMSKGMDARDIVVARAKNDEFGRWLRAKALEPREGESAPDRFRRLYGGPDEMPIGEGMARSGYQGMSLGYGNEVSSALAATIDWMTDRTPGDQTWNQLYSGYKGRESQKLKQFAREQPELAMVSEIAGAIPTAVAIPFASARTLGGKMLLGAGQGAAEGAVYGFGSGEGGFENRLKNAATTGAVGGVAGGAAPVVASGVSNLANRLLWSRAAKDAGMSGAPYRALTQAVDADSVPPGMIGSDTMLADVSPRSMRFIDVAAQSTGPQAKIVTNAVRGRVDDASKKVTQALDDTFGEPVGLASTSRELRESTAAQRGQLYETAYDTSIDYSSDAGKQMREIVDSRVPMTAINKANAMMRAEGENGLQIKVSMGKDGKLVFESMPNVRQIDYVTRALNDVAERENAKGKLGGTTQLGRVYSGLSRELRSLAREAVPEYAAALDAAATPIQARNAMIIGQDALSTRVKRDEFAEQISGLSAAELDFVKKGVRSQIDETMSNVRMALTDPNMDSREALVALRNLTTRSVREKMTTLLGDEADQFYKQIEAAIPAFEMRARTNVNSATFARNAANDAFKAQTEDGIINAIRAARPVNAVQRLAQAAMGRTPDDIQRLNDEAYVELVTALLSKGPDAQALVNKMNLAAENIPPRMDQLGRLAQRLVRGAASGTALPMTQDR